MTTHLSYSKSNTTISMSTTISRKTVLFVHLGHAFGGIEVYLDNLAQLISTDADLVAFCSHPELVRRLRARSVIVIRFPQLQGPVRALRFFIAALVLPFIIYKRRVSIVH